MVVDCLGRNGGSTLPWKNIVDIYVKPVSLNHIDFVFNFNRCPGKWRLTWVYDERMVD